MTGKEQINTLLCRKAFQKDMLERIGIDLDEEKHNVLVEVIESAFYRTDERNAEIIQKRYINFYTLERLADEYGVTKERIRQVVRDFGGVMKDEYFSVRCRRNPTETNPLLNTSVLKAGFSFRTSTALKSNGIDTIGILKQYSEKELLNCTGIGIACVQEIKMRFHKLGISLKQEL